MPQASHNYQKELSIQNFKLNEETRKELIRREDEIRAKAETRIYIKESQIEEMEDVIDEEEREIERIRDEAGKQIKALYDEYTGDLK